MAKQVSEGISEGAADVRFVIDRLTQTNQNEQQFPLAGSIDVKRLAAIGALCRGRVCYTRVPAGLADPGLR